MQRLALPEQDVEHDELSRDLRGQLPDPALRGVQPHLHRVELELALLCDDDLAVERRVRRQELAQLPELREVAQERSPVAAPERELAAVVLQHAAEPVPFGLVLPVALRKLVDELGLHRRKGDFAAGHHI